VVVVSAMGKTTNELIALAKQIAEAPSRRELDMLLTAGERITAALLAIAIAELGHEAVSLTGSQCGILTNDRHSDARIIEVRPVRVEDELARGRIVIVAGFQGMSYTREITTLGRGGSDTTAVALAAALSAESCEIYSDIDGIYSADPRDVPGARHLAVVSYEEMQEMAVAGAKVLHAQAVEFAKRKGIAIYARASFAPGRETIIRQDEPGEDRGVRAVVSEQKVAWLRVRASVPMPRCLDLLAAVERTLTSIKELRLEWPQEASESSSGSFVISAAPLNDWPRVRAELLAAGQGDLLISDDLAAIALIGIGINRDTRNVQRAVATLDALGASVHALNTSSFRISILTDNAHLQEAVRALHRAFIESAPLPPSLVD
jgi:aspartate kinase